MTSSADLSRIRNIFRAHIFNISWRWPPIDDLPSFESVARKFPRSLPAREGQKAARQEPRPPTTRIEGRRRARARERLCFCQPESAKTRYKNALVRGNPIDFHLGYERLGVMEHTRPACRFAELRSVRAFGAHPRNKVGFPTKLERTGHTFRAPVSRLVPPISLEHESESFAGRNRVCLTTHRLIRFQCGRCWRGPRIWGLLFLCRPR
jgi:hypothetical protein